MTQNDRIVCASCLDEKPLSEFGKKNGEPLPSCKECRKEYSKRLEAIKLEFNMLNGKGCMSEEMRREQQHKYTRKHRKAAKESLSDSYVVGTLKGICTLSASEIRIHASELIPLRREILAKTRALKDRLAEIEKSVRCPNEESYS